TCRRGRSASKRSFGSSRLPFAPRTTPTRSTQETAWLGPRLKAHGRFKVMAGASNVIAFFIGYFPPLSFHVLPVREMPATALDRLIAFQPGALLPYLSLRRDAPR